MKARILKTEVDYDAALQQIEALWDAASGTPEADAAELWTLLIERYEAQHHPIDIPDPISAIKFRMEQQNLKPKELVPFIGSKSRVSEVLSGKRPLSLSMIRRLHMDLGIPAEVLLQDKRVPLAPELAGIEWNRFPLAELVKRAWFPAFDGKPRDFEEQAEEMLGPLLFPGGRDCREYALAARQRIRKNSKTDDYALWAWQGRVLNLAARADVGDYDPKAMTRDFIRSVIGLSCLDEGPLLARQMLAKSGIPFVALHYLRGTHLDGAAMPRPDGKPVIALTLRHDRLDNFWFTLAHELAHVVMHLAKGDHRTFLDDLDDIPTNNAKETEADKLAAETLVSEREWNASPIRQKPTDANIRALARRLNIHPAIVAGRVRFERKDYQAFNHLVGNRVVRKMFPSHLAGDVA